MRNLFVAFTLLLAPLAHAGQTLEDTWYVVRFQGKHSGWMHQTVIQDAGRISSDSAINITIQRGPAVIEIGMATSFVETADGKPLSAGSTQKFAGQAIEKSITFGQKEMKVVSRQFGQEHVQTLPSPSGDWLTPAAAQRYVVQQTKAGEKTIRFRTLDPSTSLEPYEVTIEDRGPKDVEVYGKIVPAREHGVTLSVLPGVKSTEFSDADGHLLRTTVDIGGMNMEMIAADKKLAMAKVDPPEMLVSTLIQPEFALLKPRSMRQAAFALELKDGGKMPALPDSSVQTVERVDDQHCIVRLDLDKPKAEANAAAPAVTHNVMMNGADELIVKLTRDALRDSDGKTPEQKAEAIRRFVHGYIRTSDLSVGMASASEVARTKVGDCTEYAVLLAAMLKAAGIPARFCSGLIYVEAFAGQQRVFGYHAWAQAWLGGRWTDLDATLPGDHAFDATHILLSTSDLADPTSANDLVDLLPLMGNLTIKLAPKR
jgi:hypothetical protein